MSGNNKTNDDYFNFSLRKDQDIAFKSLKQFVSNNKDKVFILKGYAGTGKTTLISGVIKWMSEKEVNFKLLASTGRAAKILSNFTKESVKTIHSEIYVFDDIEEDLEEVSKMTNKLEVDDTGQIRLMFGLRKIQSSVETFYIIDEASMVSDSLDKSISFAKFGSGMLLDDLIKYDLNGKFIFVGDPCQLPPINQVISPALSNEHLKSNYNILPSAYELREIIRQTIGNGIIESSMALRKLHNENPHTKWAKLPVKGYNNIRLHSSHVDLVDSYLERLHEIGYEEATIICQTNRHCSDINQIVRKFLNRKSRRIEEGDLLMVTQNNYLTGLVNGDQVVITATGKSEKRCGLTFLQVTVEELAFKSEYNLLMIEDILYSNYTNLNDKQHKDLMVDYYYRMKEKGIRQKDRAFKDYMFKDPYLNALRSAYGYALTCHKSQGGEWEEVYLYLDNKIHGIPKPSIYQWWYTAITRAKKELHLVNDWFIK
ncbi:MAG: AAA family ATPase [Bacteroidales bacterium]|nr:AAA family ATPase [Bacteroidales bacterium]